MKQEFFQNGLILQQGDGGFLLGTDTMLLGDFAPARGRICDLCGGSGGLSLLLLARDPSCRLTLVELQEAPCAQAEENRRVNGLEDRMTVIQGDLRQIRALLPHGGFDGVVCNPPYYPVGAGKPAADPAAAIARSELCCTLEDLCAAAAWLLPTGGSFSLCHKPERLAELFTVLRSHGLEPKVLRLVQDRTDKAPSLVLIRAVRGGKPGLTCLPVLLLKAGDGRPSAEYRRIYHMEDQP